MIRTVADLIRELEDACAGADPAGVPVRVVSFGAYTATVHGLRSVIGSEDDSGTVYIGEGEQVGYLGSDVRSQF